MRVTIKRKLILIGIISVLSLSIITLESFLVNKRIIEEHFQTAELWNTSNKVADLRLNRLQLQLSIAKLVLNEDESKFSQYISEVKSSSSALEELFNDLSKYSNKAIDQNLLADLKAIITHINDIYTNQLTVAIKNKSDNKNIISIYENLLNLGLKFREKSNDLDNKLDIFTTGFIDNSTKDLFSAQNILLTFYTIALLIVIVLLYFITKSITNPLHNLVNNINRLSQGDYTSEFDGEEKEDEIGEMIKSLNHSITTIRDIVHKITYNAECVKSASSEISTGSIDLSSRTEQQASSLEETAASMDEITGTVRQNSTNAENASILSFEASKVAENGGQIVDKAIEAMRNIENSSKKISDIITVIDEIAFQTNLLALNAAVEAARAGEAGKGFAVVAAEVRALAGRSAQSSKEIKSLIKESVDQVANGADLVFKTGQSLKEIISSIKQVATLITDIASASKDQSLGIEEINSAISKMDESTQQNAALVEENTAAVESLMDQAKELNNLIKFFKIGDSDSNFFANNERKIPINKLPAPEKKVPAPKSTTKSSKKYSDEWEEF